VVTEIVTEWSHDQEAEEREGKRKGRHYDLFPETTIEQYKIFFVGEEGQTLNNLMMVNNQCQVSFFDLYFCFPVSHLICLLFLCLHT